MMKGRNTSTQPTSLPLSIRHDTGWGVFVAVYRVQAQIHLDPSILTRVYTMDDLLQSLGVEAVSEKQATEDALRSQVIRSLQFRAPHMIPEADGVPSRRFG